MDLERKEMPMYTESELYFQANLLDSLRLYLFYLENQETGFAKMEFDKLKVVQTFLKPSIQINLSQLYKWSYTASKEEMESMISELEKSMEYVDKLIIKLLSRKY